MTSEHDSDMNKEISRSEDDNKMAETTEEKILTEINTKNEEETDVPSSDDANASNNQESMDLEKTENDDDKEKHDVSFRSESDTHDSEVDQQPLFEQPIILDGKRSRKPTLRLEVSESTPVKKELSIPQGHGIPLGEIEYINYQITHASNDALSRMRAICFGRRGHKATIRKNLREFKGFEFERNSDEYKKHFSNLIKFRKDELKSILAILGLSSNGRNTDQAERILNFLIKPVDDGKKVPGRKSAGRSSKKRSIKKPSTNSTESIESNSEIIKEKPKKTKTETKSNYLYKPGKKSSNKRSSDHSDSTDTKRQKRNPATSESKENQDTNTVIDNTKQNDEQAEEINKTDINDHKLTEKIDVNEEPMNNAIQEVI